MALPLTVGCLHRVVRPHARFDRLYFLYSVYRLRQHRPTRSPSNSIPSQPLKISDQPLTASGAEPKYAAAETASAF